MVVSSDNYSFIFRYCICKRKMPVNTTTTTTMAPSNDCFRNICWCKSNSDCPEQLHCAVFHHRQDSG